MAKETIKGCYINSKANFPIKIRYGEDDVIIAPCAKKLFFEDASLIIDADLPKKLTKIVEK